MDCLAYREAISARIDGEDGGLEVAAVDAHLRTCPGCRRWAQAATAVTRSARVGLAEPVPDLTTDILAAIGPALGEVVSDAPATARVPATAHLPATAHVPATGRVPAPARVPAPVQRRAWAQGGVSVPGSGSAHGRLRMASPGMVARLGLFMVAIAQLLVAVPALLGNDAGAPIHVAHEQGSWSLALAVGFLVVVARPGRAAAMLPLVAALSAGLALTMVVDISAGRTQAATEAPHGLAFLGLGLLWVLTQERRWATRDTPGARTPGLPGTRKPGMARAA